MLTYQSVSKLRVAELREMLEERGLYTVGLKSVLVDRLIQWDEYYEQQLQQEGSKNENELRAELARRGRSTEGTKPILVQRLVKENIERERQLQVQRYLCGIVPSNNNDAAPKMAETSGAEAEPGPSSSTAVSIPLHQQQKTSDNTTGASAAPAAESENSEMAQVVEQPQVQSQSPGKRARSASLEDFTAHQLLTDVRNSGLFSDEDILKEMSRRDDEIKRMGMIIEKKNKIIKLQNDMINTILGV